MPISPVDEVARLKEAIDTNDLERLTTLMTDNPLLHRAPLGYGQDGPLTWLAECRIPWEAPSSARLAMARWMLEHGSDVHQGGDGPLARAALNGYRIPMMELLVSYGADVNALWHGHFPIIFSPCESLDPVALRWLLDHGAQPNGVDPTPHAARNGPPDTALDYVIGTYARSPTRLASCIDALLDAGASTRYDVPPVLDLLRGRLDDVSAHLEAEPALVHHRFASLNCGMTGGRRLTLANATLLHVAAEFGLVDAVSLLLDRGADVNACAAVDGRGIGGQSALFHAVTQFNDAGVAVATLLIERGADLSLRVQLPGHYEQPEEVVECTALGYARRFGGAAERETVLLLMASGATA